jgi:HlyD family secretion protein
MTTDVLPETLPGPETQRTQGRSTPAKPDPQGRWWKRSLLTIGVVAVAAIAATFVPKAISLPESGPKLTHTIARGNLIVTVTEQGTLESSNNTEIKCRVRGWSMVIWVVDGGTEVEAGDELVRLDTKAIEDAVSLQTTNVHTARATLERSKAEVAKAEIAIPAYLEGSYRSQLQALERWRTIAEANLDTAKKNLANSEKLFKRGYVNELEVESNALMVTQAELELKVRENAIEVLNKYTKEMRLETLKGNLTASKSKLEADLAGLEMDEKRLKRAQEELEQCVIKAERSGLVIYPSAAEWKETPDITEGANVRKDQVLLLMPDLSEMQVKVGIHESIVDRVKPGQIARITLPDQTIEGKVSSVASVTKPAGWWTGNVVKYDTIIELPPVDGLKPGMSAEVEVIVDRHEDVLTIPVAAVVETAKGEFCWVRTDDGIERRSLTLGDTDDSFIVAENGLKEGDEVVLNPLAVIEEAQTEVRKPFDEALMPEPSSDESGNELTELGEAEARHAD